MLCNVFVTSGQYSYRRVLVSSEPRMRLNVTKIVIVTTSSGNSQMFRKLCTKKKPIKKSLWAARSLMRHQSWAQAHRLSSDIKHYHPALSLIRTVLFTSWHVQWLVQWRWHQSLSPLTTETPWDWIGRIPLHELTRQRKPQRQTRLGVVNTV